MKPDKKLVNNIVLVKTPSTKKELDCFLGLENYFCLYIKNLASIVEPLNR